MSSVLHIEIPRAFTLAIREFNVRVCMQLEERGITYQQVDLNPTFWDFIFRKLAPNRYESLCQVFHSFKPYSNAYFDVAEGLVEIRKQLSGSGIAIRPDGVYPVDESVLNAAARIYNLVHDGLPQLFTDFFEEIDRHQQFEKYDLISFGITGQSSFVLAFGLAQYIKSRYRKLHICIGNHHYENFSLLLTLDRIAASSAIFQCFDSISLYEEKLGDTLVGILNGKTENYSNCASMNGIEVEIKQPAGPVIQYSKLSEGAVKSLVKYVRSLGVTLNHVHYNMQLIGNQCYYSRCTFCAQINKHLSPRTYNESGALSLSLDVLRQLSAAGIRYFSFTDEALRPADLADLAQNLEQNQLDIRWSMRLIANTKISKELIERLQHIGCREVLFGLETIDSDIASTLGKVSSKSELEAINEMVFNFTSSGINVILSMIYDVPGFGIEKDEELFAYARRMLMYNPRVIFIFNAFVLFGGTPIFKNPFEYSIEEIESVKPENDLQHAFSFSTAPIVKAGKDAFQSLNLHPCKNVSVILDNPEHLLTYQIFHHFRYTSFGFTFEQELGQPLYTSLTARYEKV